jgi:hypothetical protein
VSHLPSGARATPAFRCTCHTWLQVHVPHLTSVHVSLLPSGSCAPYPIRCTCHTWLQYTCRSCLQGLVPHILSGARATPSLRRTCHTCFKVCIAHLPSGARAKPDFSALVAPAFRGLCHISHLRCPWRTCLLVHVPQPPQYTDNTHATLYTLNMPDIQGKAGEKWKRECNSACQHFYEDRWSLLYSTRSTGGVAEL